MPGRSRAGTWTLCLTYAVLALLYNTLTPIGEAPDELAHFEYVNLVVEQRRLPARADNFWQGHQAPLYYFAQAGWSQIIRATSGCRVERARLPGRVSPTFLRSPNFNFLVHGPSERLASWGCTEWAFHLLRLLSTALTVPMILLTLAILREAAPGAPAIVAVGGMLTALVPSHVAISAMLNNDALVNLLIVAATYLVIRTSQSGEPTILAAAIVTAAVAATAKLSALYLFGLVPLAPILSRELRERLVARGRGRMWVAAATLAAVLPIVLLVRNFVQWGDLFAVAALERNLELLTASGANPPSRGILHYYAVELPTLLVEGSLVAFGAVNFRVGGSFAAARWAVWIIGAGLLLGLVRRETWRDIRVRPLLILLAGCALFFFTYVYPGYRYRWLQVRYFFNQLPLASLVAAVGLLSLWHGLVQMGLRLSDRLLVALVYVGLVALNLLVLVEGVIAHLYRYLGPAG
jgi:hypothetical protein